MKGIFEEGIQRWQCANGITRGIFSRIGPVNEDRWPLRRNGGTGVLAEVWLQLWIKVERFVMGAEAARLSRVITSLSSTDVQKAVVGGDAQEGACPFQKSVGVSSVVLDLWTCKHPDVGNRAITHARGALQSSCQRGSAHGSNRSHARLIPRLSMMSAPQFTMTPSGHVSTKNGAAMGYASNAVRWPGQACFTLSSV